MHRSGEDDLVVFLGVAHGVGRDFYRNGFFGKSRSGQCQKKNKKKNSHGACLLVQENPDIAHGQDFVGL